MNKIIEFFKRIFGKKPLALNEPKVIVDEDNFKNKNTFLDNIKVENDNNDILIVQKNLENNNIMEDELSDEQIIKLKNLYCTQIYNLAESINNYRLRLN